MSAFLGPIHYWMYNKIKVQQNIVDDIVKLGEEVVPGLKEKLDSKYGVSETRPLEEVIDQSNIHGWLQENVTREEYKLADSITSILEAKPEMMDKIKEVFTNRGKDLSEPISLEDASQAYKMISDSLLDGMPCDHANSVVEESQEKVIWKRNLCVHSDYWQEVNGDIKIYYALREEFIKGALSGTPYVFDKIDEDTSVIKES
jgi:hypothetical protein